jgi:hypothetical protein
LTPLAKKLLIVLLGVLVMTATMVLTIHFRGIPGAGGRIGLTLLFEVTDPKADLAAELSVVRRRLAGIPLATADKAGPGKIAVWIAYSLPLQQAWSRQQQAVDEFRKTTLSSARLAALINAGPDEQTAEMVRVAPLGSALYDDLPALTRAADQLAAARRAAERALAAAAPSTAQSAPPADVLEQAARQFDAAQARVFANLLDATRLLALLTAADDPANPHAVRRRDELAVRYPAQATEILHVITAHRAWVAAGGTSQPGPDDVERRLQSNGLLEFRIAVQGADLAKTPGIDAYRLAMDSLLQHGPYPLVHTSAGTLRWCEIDEDAGDLPSSGYITGYAAAHPFLLCYHDRTLTLTHTDPALKPWGVQPGDPYVDPTQGGAILPLILDANGASYLADLTGHNQGRPLAILVDDRVLCAPVIHSQISDSAVIILGPPTPVRPAAALQKRLATLRQLMQLAPLPSPLRRVQ